MRSSTMVAATAALAASLAYAAPAPMMMNAMDKNMAMGTATMPMSSGTPSSSGGGNGNNNKTNKNSNNPSSGSTNAPSGSGSGAGYGVNIVGNGFPAPDPEQLLNVEKQAKGTLSNAPPPAKLSDDTATSLRLIAFNENFEAVYFQSLLNNITAGVPGYGMDQFESENQRQFVIRALSGIVAQEELHSINAQTALQKVLKTNRILPCRYQFPVSDFKSAISLASRFTDVVMGTLADVQFQAAVSGDAGLVPGVASALGNEGEQTGWFRSLQGLRPSELPFLTRSVRNFAFSALQDFVVPGSCPNVNEIGLTIYQPLHAADPPAKTSDVTFTFNYKQQTRAVPQGVKTVDVTGFGAKYANGAWRDQIFITYLNQQNVPVSRLPKSVDINQQTGEVKLVAEFPYDAVVNGAPLEMNGLTLATLTAGQNFADAAAMDAATLFGPAPLEAQEM